jgi:tetratricopeptide (TPR) repeat protein
VSGGVFAAAVIAILAFGPQAPPRRAPAPATPDRAALLIQADEAQKTGNDNQAARLFQLAADRYKSVQGYLGLARLQSKAKDYAAALVSLTAAREIAPNSEDVLSAYAQVALAAKQSTKAVAALASLTRMYPSVAQYDYLLGIGLMSVGDMDSAVGALEDANRLEPDRPLTLLALGLALNNRKLFAEARTALARSIELQSDGPEGVEAVAALAEAEAGLGDLDNATRHAQQALHRAPANATANLVVGLVALERRQYPEARDALLAANRADPESPKVLYQLSLAFARLGDDGSARRYVEAYQEKLRGVQERINALRADGTFTPPASKR